ncbi:hypothetical protein [Lysobacter sp. ESA13C]|uniref:hypothetical protein n=1 Tax=Lysobacter sp. ESA13C TaxID=2862676 RepID=UPI001CC0C13F|nr:hypothetical protein [Lysobacter sp. ESA13C]
MATKREIFEAIVFLPAMAALAALAFVAFAAIIYFGWGVVYGWHWLLRGVLHLPRIVAQALTVILSAFTVYGTFYYAGRINWPSWRRKPKA